MAVTGFTINNASVNTVATSGTATVPTVAAGDTLIVLGSQNTGTVALSLSGGNVLGGAWTVLSGPDDNSANDRTYVWLATATSTSTGATITLSTATGGRLIGVGAAVSGYLATGALLTLSSVTVASSSVPFPSVTVPDATGWLLLGLCSLRTAAVTAASLTAPGGSTVAAESASAYTTSANFDDAVISVTLPVGSGSQSPGTGTASQSIPNCQLYTVALPPLVQPRLPQNRARFHASNW